MCGTTCYTTSWSWRTRIPSWPRSIAKRRQTVCAMQPRATKSRPPRSRRPWLSWQSQCRRATAKTLGESMKVAHGAPPKPCSKSACGTVVVAIALALENLLDGTEDRFSSAIAKATATVPHVVLEHGFGDAPCATFIDSLSVFGVALCRINSAGGWRTRRSPLLILTLTGVPTGPQLIHPGSTVSTVSTACITEF